MRILCLFAFMLSSAGGVRAEESAAAGRRVFEKNQAAVVTVQLVVGYHMSYQGQTEENEIKTEAVGTIIDPSGLTVISLATIDPSALMNAREGMQQSMRVDSTVKEAKLLLADGGEVPVKVVLRDKDIDVAFLRPTAKPAKPLPSVDLRSAVKPVQLDEAVCLTRLGRIANRVVAVSLERIDALVGRPRPFYVLSPGGSSGIGSPVFALSGAPLGIVLLRTADPDGSPNAGSMFSGGGNAAVMPIIVPAADIMGDAKQALEAT